MTFDSDTAQADTAHGAAEAVKANAERAVNQGEHFVNAAEDGLNRMENLREQTVEKTRQIVQTSLAVASHQAREAGERFSRTLGLDGRDSQQLADQSKRNLEAIARCGTVLTQAFHDTSRELMTLGQKRLQRNLDGLQRLTQVRSVHEYATVQSELLRVGMQELVEDGRTIAERSLRVAEEAGEAFADVAARGRRA